MIAATSAPPTAASRATWSPRTGRARRNASRIAAHLRIQARSSMGRPPRPVTTEASVPHMAATRVRGGRWSRRRSGRRGRPGPSRSRPPRRRSACRAAARPRPPRPSARPRCRSARCRAGRGARPRPAGAAPDRSPARRRRSVAVAPNRPASTATGLPPSSTARTSRGRWRPPGPETPSEAIPWSAANSTTRGLLDRPDRHLPLRGGEPLGEVVEPAQRAGRHGQPFTAVLGVTPDAPVGALDQIGEVVEIQRAHLPKRTAGEAHPRGVRPASIHRTGPATTGAHRTPGTLPAVPPDGPARRALAGSPAGR